MVQKSTFLLFFAIIFLTSNLVWGYEKKDSLINRIQLEKQDTAKVDLLFQLIELLYISDIEQAMNYNDSALRIVNKVRKGADEKEKLFFRKAMADAYDNSAYFYFIKGSIDSCLLKANEAISIKKKNNDKKGLAYSLGNLGYYYSQMGELQKSIELNYESVKLLEQINDKQGLIIAYNTLGQAYINTKDFTNSLMYLKKSYNLSLELNDRYGIGYSLNNIGLVFFYNNQKDSAIDYYMKALPVKIELSDTVGIASCYNNIGLFYYESEYPDSALFYYKKALELQTMREDLNGQNISFANISDIYYKKRNFKLAMEFADRALEIALILKYKEAISLAYLQQSNIFSKQKEFEKSLDCFKKYVIYRDSIYSEKNTKEITRLEMKYLNEKELAIQKAEHEKITMYQSEKLKQQQILIVSFILGFVIIISFSLFLYRLFVQKRKANILLAQKNIEVEQKNEEITAQRDEIEAQRDEIAKSRDLVLFQKEEIESSINYAQRIQHAVLPSEEFLKMFLSEYFILFRPKDIVSGDFYWATLIKNWQIVTVADCTGHGVPGAFMSMLGVSFLNEIVRKQEVTKANDVLNHLRKSVIESLKQTGESGTQKDGMDISLCVINIEDNMLQWAGANNPLWIVRKIKVESHAYQQAGQKGIEANIETLSTIGTLSTFEHYELKGDKMPIAIYERMDEFTNHELQLFSGDTIYMMSDGYEDQFGGLKHKKFLSKNLKQLLTVNCQLPMNEQKNILEKTLIDWIGGGEQIDDITVLGIKI